MPRNCRAADTEISVRSLDADPFFQGRRAHPARLDGIKLVIRHPVPPHDA
jgi:hypothetical protein